MTPTTPNTHLCARKRALRPLEIVAALIGALITIATAQTFNLDGYKTAGEASSYTNKQAFLFYNGHGSQDVYGTLENPVYQTYVHWGQGKLTSEPLGPDYFFMYVETPIEVKNMVWGDGMTAEEVSQYGKQLDYGGAVGSEYMAFVLPSGDGGDNPESYPFWSYTDPSYGADGESGSYGSEWSSYTYGFIDAKNTAEYILENGLGTESSSANHDIGMGFEYQFELNDSENNALLDILRVQGGVIEYHLSPERGGTPTQVSVVPEPSVTLLLAGAMSMLLRRRR